MRSMCFSPVEPHAVLAVQLASETIVLSGLLNSRYNKATNHTSRFGVSNKLVLVMHRCNLIDLDAVIDEQSMGVHTGLLHHHSPG